ncbi:astacin-like metalloprotease toxin 5, partial [Centruroides sculpturatus]|uniref:astacin-like metalloprotease toxin 5 n=1 Tax=Centruroides sculpturatus TaxID=218467 RepID=UPI000C6E3583
LKIYLNIFVSPGLSSLFYLNPNLFEGDILGARSSPRQNRNIKRYSTWPMGRIPYQIKFGVRYKLRRLIYDALSHYEKLTCIRFVHRTYERDYVMIYEGTGCHSYIGRKGGKQVLSLGRRCNHFPIVVHEFGHVVGLYHEHTRPDRDDYLIIHWNNIQKGMETQFSKRNNSDFDTSVEFDYESIMLYGDKFFSKNGISKTMEGKNGTKLELLQNKYGLSEHDVIKIKKLY